ncbi:AraC family transcriptional regulator [Dyadobacter flavalbus]|uniref:AraC family transcriptional regulator n=1 Tax=Dyadobacter flavalbus TaxID=2579942 RepID=A0A5M8R4J6_9BACT|nr:AraC family transcriptional regulator [Dyadobacter flavalbus]KAA6441836.1 AraC family transcriptional regulator [Dyadobacter flavalbus]
MKPQLHSLIPPGSTSFLYETWQCNYFDKPWHFHKEYELVMIEKGRGIKYIGDHVSAFDEGDLSLIGSNIPHLFRNSDEYYLRNGELEAKSVFIHFKEDFLGSGFFEIPEMNSVRRLLDNSSLALEIQGKTKRSIIRQLNQINEENGTRRILSLLSILVELSESKELKPLLSNSVSVRRSSDTEKISKIFEFIQKNYTQEIYVEEVATLLNMSPASFSRYFRHHTLKTFSDCVTEIRVSHACKLLMQNNHSVSQISYMSGFENISNFYRHFKRITGVKPKYYRDRFINSCK